MAPATPLLRYLRLLALLVQLALPSLGVVADAQLELAAVDARIHIESESHDCEQSGHPEHCALCQFLRTQPLASEASHDLAIDAGAETLFSAQSTPHHPEQRLPSLPRAPPLLS